MKDSNTRVLQLEELSKQYGRRVAVDELSFEVLRGDVFGFIGQNGAGKSTTTVLRHTCTLQRITPAHVAPPKCCGEERWPFMKAPESELAAA